MRQVFVLRFDLRSNRVNYLELVNKTNTKVEVNAGFCIRFFELSVGVWFTVECEAPSSAYHSKVS